MKRSALLMIVPFVLALGATLHFMGVFTSDPTTTTPETPPPPPEDTPKAGSTTLTAEEPGSEPAAEFPTFEQTRRVLLISRFAEPWPAFLLQSFDGQDKIRYRTYVQDEGSKPLGNPATAPYVEPPGPEALEDVDVVVLRMVDTQRLAPAFFEALARRVKAGTTGLLVMPGVMGGSLLDQPDVAPLLPIAKASPISGSPVPGTYPDGAPFVPTEAGVRHPATRIVSFPKWSESIWRATRTPATYTTTSGTSHKTIPWAAKFVYPVETLREGAVSLLEVEGRGGTRVPAIVASAPASGRVLWFGCLDFGEGPYRDSNSARKMTAMVLNWVAWLATPNA